MLAGLVVAVSAAAQPPTTTLVYPPWSHCYGLHRVNQTHLNLRAGFRHRFEDPQGMAAVKLDCEDDPTTPRDDDELTVFGVNSGGGTIIYNTSLTSIAFYGRPGEGAGEFRQPHGIAADRHGHVVVADTGNDRLQLLQYADDALAHSGFIAGSFEGRVLRGPTGVAIEGDEIYACDPDGDRILVFDLQGHFRRALRPEQAGRPVLHQPFAVAVIRRDSENNFFGEDFVAVTDSAHGRLWRLDPQSGQPQAVRRARELAISGGAFDYVAIDYYGNVYCSDRGGHLHKFDRDLRPLLTIGRPGHGDYEFDEPRGIGLYRRFGQMFVAEREGAQYLWIGTDVFTPSVTQLEPQEDGAYRATVRFFLTEYARVTLDLVDAAGTVQVPVQPSTWTPPGAVERRVRFVVPPGTARLRMRVEAVPTYSARKILRVDKQTPPLNLARVAGGP
jgi:NHL repeat